MTRLDKALEKLKQPQRLGETIIGLPCDLCDKPHTTVIGVRIAKDLLVWEIHSPCLDEIARKAVGIVNRLVK